MYYVSPHLFIEVATFLNIFPELQIFYQRLSTEN